MAKRRRLEASSPVTPAPTKSPATSPAADTTGPGADAAGLETKSITRLSGMPPIADIAGQAAALNAADAAVAEIAAARADGRLVIRVALETIDRDHLVRDRLVADDEEMAALKASIAAHGQRTPVELVDLGAERPGRYGLISGWRRMAALAALHAETGDGKYAEVLAILRRPEEAADAYIAMVEENEIRVGLSYYERARIAALSAERGAFADAAAAVDALYAAGSKAKRSKIRGFLLIHEVLGAALSFPADIPERLGLSLVQAIRQGGTQALLAALSPPAATAAAEAAALSRAIQAGGSARASSRRPAQPAGIEAGIEAGIGTEIAPGIRMGWSRPVNAAADDAAGTSAPSQSGGRVLMLSGPRVTPALEARLAAFLAAIPEKE